MTTIQATYIANEAQTAGTEPWLKLDQPEYSMDDLANITTAMAMVNLARSGQNAQIALLPCDGLEVVDATEPGEVDDDQLRIYTWTTKIYVSISADFVTYELKASRGEFGEMFTETTPHEKSFTFTDNDHVDLGLQVEEGWSLTWETPAYDANNRTIPCPDLKINGQFLVASRSCFGVVRLKYDALRHVWPLTIPDNGTEDAFPSTVSCFWSGGVDQLDVETAPCVADRLAECGGNGGGTGNITPPGNTLHVEYDACYGTVVGEYYA